MATISDPALRSVFQPNEEASPRALVVAGACGNVGLGKLGQFARLLTPHGIPVVALDPSPAVHELPSKLRAAFGDRFKADEIDRIVAGITIVQGGPEQLPAQLGIGLVFEAIPERLPLKHAFYQAVHARQPDAYITSATSGFPTTQLFGELAGKARCTVLHPFFPHLTNKLFELPVEGAVTGKAELGVMRKLLSSLGMNLIEVRDVPAFAADRLFCGMMLEAVRIHDALGLSPAQIDDACRQLLGTSPFYVHNMIPGANYLSAHCMQLMAAEVDSTLFAIPECWRPYIEDPKKQWPYERGQSCPPDRVPEVRARMFGMLIALVAGMVEGKVASLPAINFLSEQALAFREGVPALIARLGLPQARELLAAFVDELGITHADHVAPASALQPGAAAWNRIYVDTAVHDGVGLLSLRRTTLSDTFLAEIDDAYQQLSADPNVKAIVLAPDGRHSREFGHGADLQAFVPVLGDEAAAAALIDRWKRTCTKLRSGKPTVAALVGRALGGSLELAAACHARIAASGTKLAFPETTVGVIPGLGGCHMVHRASRTDAAAAIDRALLTGATIAAETAASWGFVHDVVPVAELPGKSMAFARALADGSTAMPSFRAEGAAHEVATDVPGTNEAGVKLSAALRELLVATIRDANGATLAEGAAIESQRAAQSLAAPAAKVGVTAMLRGKPPVFADPIG
ncbi:MAG: enoyl-CoA hydratase/isomerase family protein [Deltaproteobacteria bacterium]|nr:enoyl-CoA hydratase/isomerase family protein [Deltaproteobacteria bacterium]